MAIQPETSSRERDPYQDFTDKEIKIWIPRCEEAFKKEVSPIANANNPPERLQQICDRAVFSILPGGTFAFLDDMIAAGARAARRAGSMARLLHEGIPESCPNITPESRALIQ